MYNRKSVYIRCFKALVAIWQSMTVICVNINHFPYVTIRPHLLKFHWHNGHYMNCLHQQFWNQWTKTVTRFICWPRMVSQWMAAEYYPTVWHASPSTHRKVWLHSTTFGVWIWPIKWQNMCKMVLETVSTFLTQWVRITCHIHVLSLRRRQEYVRDKSTQLHILTRITAFF